MARGVDASFDASALAAFRDRFRGRIVLPEDPDYDALRVVWNGIADRRPAVIVGCGGAEDVARAVRFAQEQDLVVAVRGGGHSVAGFSTCDGGVVIDLSGLRGVTVDPERRVARANGGAHLSELDREAQMFGLACPVGVVGHTGVAGLTLGGGMGRLMRRHGLTVDNLRAVDLVTAEGRLVHASEDENADLFWGVRGAGANFGVVTSFEFELHRVGPTVVHGMVMHPIERAHEMAALFSDLAASAPDEVMLTMGFGRALPEGEFPPEIAGRPEVIVSATHCGPVEEAERYLELLRGDGAVLDTFGPKPYLEVQSMGDEANAWGKRFYMKGAYLSSLPDELVDGCVEEVAKAPGECGISLWAMGGAVARVPNDAMAFTGRDAAFWLGVEATWEDAVLDDAHIAWGRATMAALTPFTMAGHYVNDMVERGEDVVRSIYGDEKYERLVGLKRAWDPDNVFRLNQNIVP